MSSTTYGFVTMEDHDTFIGDGRLTFSVDTHTGRSGRQKQFDLTNDSGEDATVVVAQQAASYILAFDRWENENHDAVSVIGSDGGTYYMVGHANTNFIGASEVVSGTAHTDLNNMTTGLSWTIGMTITEANGSTHPTGSEPLIMNESSIAYGTDAQYTFKIPILFGKTNEEIVIKFEITDDVHTVSVEAEQGAPST